MPPAPEAAPNILLIVLDTVRADALSCMGYHRETTPNLDALAARGIIFQQAYAPRGLDLALARQHVHWPVAQRAVRPDRPTAG